MAKILHFITGVEMDGGAEHMLLKTLPFLKSAEHAVCAIKGRGKIGAQLEALGVKVFYLEAKRLVDFGLIGRYKKVINDFKPDIQVNYLIHADIFGRIFAKRFGVKKLISYIRNRHTKFIFKFFDFLTLSRVDYLLANSEAVLNFYRRQYHFTEARSSCIANGIDWEMNQASPDELNKLKAELALNDKDFVLLAIASFKKQKDLPTLLRALALVKEKGSCQPRLLLCGQGREKENLEQLVGVLGLEANVNFLGVRSDVFNLFTVSNAFVLPSLHEGMSNALLEAMVFGKPCIVSAIPENTELIKDKENGLTFNPGDEKDLAEKISIICVSPSQAASYGAKARAAAQRYDVKKIIKELDDFFLARLAEGGK
jgi:glycosyltransferase involved in cell wall biosynthesis